MNNFNTKRNTYFSFFVSFAFLFLSNISFGQVSGVVTDANTGDPLIGASVFVVGNETLGTVTDYEGRYELGADVGQTLSFSYIGYKTQEILITSLSPLNVSLEEGQLLEEVVVVGYGTVGKKDLTGAVEKIDEKSFNRGVISSPENLLNGKVAGLQIRNNGEPGGGLDIRLRGQTSILTDSKPLVVIDGIPVDVGNTNSSRNPLNFINTNDVESISVLKDASAAAIYGSRGANGVILITTKKGAKGKLQLSYTGSANVAQFSGDSRVFNTDKFKQAINAKAPDEYDYLGTANTDWVDEVLGNAWGTEHQLALSGGTKNLIYRVGAQYQRTDGVIKTSRNESTNLSAVLSGNFLDDKLKLTYRNKTGFIKDQYAPNVIGAAMSFDPTRPVKDSDSPYGGYFEWSNALAVKNPVAQLYLQDNHGNTFRTLNSLELVYDLPFLEGLSFHTNVSQDFTSGDKYHIKYPELREVYTTGGSIYDERDSEIDSKLLESFVTWKKKNLAKDLNFDLTLGYSWQEIKRSYYREGGQELVKDDGGNYYYTDTIEYINTLPDNKLISFFGRTNINFKEKYLLTLSLRRDGSSRFGPDNRWGLFPAAAFAWRVLEEPFAVGLKDVFSNLKFRVGWGVTGNQGIGDYLFNTFYSYGTDDAEVQFGDEYIKTLRAKGVDPNIQWEETRSTNIGIDFGFTNNKYSGSLEVYRKFTNELLFTVATPAFTNLSDRILTNIGQMENKGIELALNAVLIDKKDFDFNAGFNVAYNKNKIIKLDNSTDPKFPGYEYGGIAGDVGQTIQVLKVDESFNTFRTYQHIYENGVPRVDNKDYNGDGLIDNLDIYEDINNDGLINENDLVAGKNALPDWILGLTLNSTYKKFDFAMTFRANLGNYVYDNVSSSMGYFQRLSDLVTNNVVKDAFEYNFTNRQLKSDVYIKNASFVKLDNFTVGYNVPSNKIFRSLRFSLTVQNLLTITGYKGSDPEAPQINNGIDNNLYPASRRFIAGLSANF